MRLLRSCLAGAFFAAFALGSLLLGFFCEVDGDARIRVDGAELKEGRWFTAAEIDFPDDGVSLTREMIEVFRRGGLR